MCVCVCARARVCVCDGDLYFLLWMGACKTIFGMMKRVSGTEEKDRKVINFEITNTKKTNKTKQTSITI